MAAVEDARVAWAPTHHWDLRMPEPAQPSSWPRSIKEGIPSSRVPTTTHTIWTPASWTLMRDTEYENPGTGNLEWLIRKDGCENPGTAVVQYSNGEEGWKRGGQNRVLMGY